MQSLLGSHDTKDSLAAIGPILVAIAVLGISSNLFEGLVISKWLHAMALSLLEGLSYLLLFWSLEFTEVEIHYIMTVLTPVSIIIRASVIAVSGKKKFSNNFILYVFARVWMATLVLALFGYFTAPMSFTDRWIDTFEEEEVAPLIVTISKGTPVVLMFFLLPVSYFKEAYFNIYIQMAQGLIVAACVIAIDVVFFRVFN